MNAKAIPMATVRNCYFNCDMTTGQAQPVISVLKIDYTASDVTLRTKWPHNMQKGDEVLIAGSPVASFNGRFKLDFDPPDYMTLRFSNQPTIKLKETMNTLRNCMRLCAGLLALSCGIIPIRGNVIVVGGDANQEGGVTGASFGSGEREQFGYDASEFLDAMPNGGIISEVAFRVDGTVPFDINMVIPEFELRMSTTPSLLPVLDLDWSRNIGPDETTVFGRGPLPVQYTSSPPGPNPFQVRIPLATPFRYDPRRGSLLLDLFVYDGGVPTRLDSAGLRTAQKISGAVGQPFAIDGNSAPVMQVVFTPIPEPSALAFFLLGASFVVWFSVAIHLVCHEPA